MEALSSAQRSAPMWLNVDDVLARLPISRSSFWRLVSENLFPAPYYWGKTPLWTQADIGAFIDGCIARDDFSKDHALPAVTWDDVRKLLKGRAPQGLTNKQIAHHLNAEVADVSALTRLMSKAGILVCLRPIRFSGGVPNFYVYKTDEAPAHNGKNLSYFPR